MVRRRAVERMQRYTERQLARGERLSAVIRHMQGLYAGEPGASEFRRTLNENARRPGAGAEVLAEAVASAQRSLSGDSIPAQERASAGSPRCAPTR
ncbi:MAG: tRNA-dihydrouridine synthase [Steroidobacteraceae bacterium]